MRTSPHVLTLACLLLTAFCLAACGGSGGGGAGHTPFVIDPTAPPPADGGTQVPPPAPGDNVIWTPEAHAHLRIPAFGAFPSDLVRREDRLYAVDADQIDDGGAHVVTLQLGAARPTVDSTRPVTRFVVGDLLDSTGQAPSLSDPIGFGFFLNELEVVSDSLAFLCVGAGGSDSLRTLSNVLVFDPSTGVRMQTLNIANPFTAPHTLVDSTNNPVPNNAFVQAGPEALAYVSTGPTTGHLYVAMSNLVVGAPSYGTVKYPGTVQRFDVDLSATPPVRPHDDGSGLVTQTLLTAAYNPVSLDVLKAPTGSYFKPRLLVTCGGATGYDASFQLVPQTPSAVLVYDSGTASFLGQFNLGLTGLVSRPALGTDGFGHHVGIFPSGTTGQAYLLHLDGLVSPTIDLAQLAILRGPTNGIPFDPGAGTPAGNISGVALAPNGRTLVASTFGDFFTGQPGRLLLLSLPFDLVSDSGFVASFTPGVTSFDAPDQRSLGQVALWPNNTEAPTCYVNVGGRLGTTGLGEGPASVGALDTGELIR